MLCMGRSLRTCLPQIQEQLVPKWPYLPKFRALNLEYKKKQKRDFDKRHRTQDVEDIPSRSKVWITSEGRHTEGRVVSPAESPRSYLVDTPTGVVRQNRQHLNVAPPAQENSEPDTAEQCTDQPPQNRIVTRSETGTTVKPPERLYKLTA